MTKLVYIFFIKHFQSISAAMAFVVWGGWAFYVNDSSTLYHRLITAIAQGTFSLIVTLLVLGGVTIIYQNMGQSCLRYFVPAIVMVLITGVIIISIHIVIGTPEIAVTVSPGLIMTFFYSILTAVKIAQAETMQI